MPRQRNHPELPSLLQTRFTDRDDHIHTFAAYLEAVTGPLPALMYYGVGGTGKSWLLRQLRTRLAGPWQVPSVLIDFSKETGSNAYLIDPLLVLGELRTITTAPCPCFDLAFALALVRRYRQDESALQNKWKTSTISSGWEVIKAAGGALHPILGGALAVLEKGYDLMQDHSLLRRIRDQFVHDLAGLQAKDLATIERELTWRLAEDLKAENVLPARQGYRAVQAVVFVDTLEALIPTGMSEPDQERASAWLRELITELRGRILFVLAGQNRLEWGFLHPDWEDRDWIEQHLLGGLTAPDACEYFGRCGITDKTVQQAMLDHCLRMGNEGYHTASLGLLADVAWLEARRGGKVSPALFAEVDRSDMASLVRRFLKSLPSAADQDWIRRLAATPAFDEAAARAMHSAQWSQGADTAWEMLAGLSFLTPSPAEAGWYSIHSTVQEALRKSGQLPRQWHEKWRAYWESQGGDLRSTEAGLAWFHHWSLDRIGAREAWNAFAEKARQDLAMELHLALIDWWTSTGLAGAHPQHEDDAADLISLGVELYYASLGSRGANLRQAIACYQNALRVYTREAFPADWTMTQNKLGIAHANLPDGDRGANLREAITCYQNALQVCTREAFPADWAMTQNNLGIAHANLPDGDRGANLRLAITCYQNVLQVRTREAFPAEWAMTQNNLGIVHQILPDGDRGANLRLAITCYQNALQVRTREAFPADWAMTQNNLGIVHQILPDGDRGANLRLAITCYQNALQVRTREAFPADWAMTQNNLGIVHQILPDGDRGTNLREAITCYQNALQVSTREAFPAEWATTQNNLGNAYQDLPDGDRGANLRQAIACYQNALQVRTREAFPADWAMTQNNLGNAHTDLPDGDRGANLREAITCYQSALQVYTREAFPAQWAEVQDNWGLVSEKQADLSPDVRLSLLGDAANRFRRAIEVFDQLGYERRASECREHRARIEKETLFPPS